MREENPIAEARIGGRTEVSAGPAKFLIRVGMLGGRFRWVIFGLLFLGVTKNYMDRQALGVFKGPLQHKVGWNEIDYGNPVFALPTTYALGLTFLCRFIHRLRARIR